MSRLDKYGGLPPKPVEIPDLLKWILEDLHGLRTTQNLTFTRDSDGNITKIEITRGNLKKTINISRDSDGNISSITETLEVI